MELPFGGLILGIYCKIAFHKQCLPCHPMVSTIIPGVSNPEKALQNLEAVSVEIPDQFWNDLERLVMDMSESRFIVEIKDVIE
tara:strand:+ start:11329 stop:11577 length:249 start_codon:yes stop_codon:yes gene_type:complete